jgi:small subunit ribosomal protein S20
MAHHQSAKKRIRQNQKLREQNRYYTRSTRSAMKKLRDTSEKEAAAEQLPKVFSMLDKLTRRHVIHKNKAANLKSRLVKHVNSL